MTKPNYTEKEKRSILMATEIRRLEETVLAKKQQMIDTKSDFFSTVKKLGQKRKDLVDFWIGGKQDG